MTTTYTWFNIDQNMSQLLDVSTGFIRQEKGGFSIPDFDRLIVRSPLQDGGTYVDSYFMPRKWSLNLYVVAATQLEYEAKMRLLGRLFNPKDAGYLQLVDENGTNYYLYGRLSAPPTVSNYHVSHSQVLLQFESADPYFYGDSTYYNFNIAAPATAMKIAFAIPFAITPDNSSITIENTGYVASWPIVVISGGGSGVTNARLENITNGGYLEYSAALAAGDHLTVDMGLRTAVLDAGTNVFASLDGNFWALEPGINNIHITLGGSGGAISGNFTWNPRYLAAL